MKPLGIAVLNLLAVLWANAAYASTIPPGDPHIKTGGASGTGAVVQAGDPPAAIITPDFSIFSRTGASPATSACVLIQGTIKTSSPLCEFKNEITVSGVAFAITKLVFNIANVAPSTVTCGFLVGSPFLMCNVGPFGDGGTMVTFFDGSIPFDTSFSLEFGSPTDPFPPNTTSAVAATLSPEPGTLALFLGGIGALLLGRGLRTHKLGSN